MLNINCRNYTDTGIQYIHNILPTFFILTAFDIGMSQLDVYKRQEFALKNGCQASRVSIYNGSSSSFEIRDMKMDRLQQASENSLVIHLFVDGRFGSFSRCV